MKMTNLSLQSNNKILIKAISNTIGYGGVDKGVY
jgi:hypothetical protein